MDSHFCATQVFFNQIKKLSHAHFEASFGILRSVANPKEYFERIVRLIAQYSHVVFLVDHKVRVVRIELGDPVRLAHLEGQMLFALKFPD